MDPALGVGAVERRKRGLPCVGALVALGLVDVVGDGPELRAGEVVGELLSLGGRPGARTRLVGAYSLTSGQIRLRGAIHTTQAFFRGTMWSISTSEAAVHVAPS